jgi:hypothetical protein
MLHHHRDAHRIISPQGGADEAAPALLWRSLDAASWSPSGRAKAIITAAREAFATVDRAAPDFPARRDAANAKRNANHLLYQRELVRGVEGDDAEVIPPSSHLSGVPSSVDDYRERCRDEQDSDSCDAGHDEWISA